MGREKHAPGDDNVYCLTILPSRRSKRQLPGPSGCGCVDRAPEGQRSPHRATPLTPFSTPLLPSSPAFEKKSSSKPPQEALSQRLSGVARGVLPHCIQGMNQNSNQVHFTPIHPTLNSHSPTPLCTLIIVLLPLLLLLFATLAAAIVAYGTHPTFGQF